MILRWISTLIYVYLPFSVLLKFTRFLCILRRIIEEKKETSIEEKQEEIAGTQQPPAEEPVYVEPQQPAPSVPSAPQPVVPSTPAPVAPQNPGNKQFLFSEGYNMENVSGACMAYITGYTGGCYPLQDANGIYYGMEARFE